MKQIKFESLKSKIEACRESFPGISNHPWTSRIVVSKISKKVSKLKLNLKPKIEDCRKSFAGIFNIQFEVEFQI